MRGVLPVLCRMILFSMGFHKIKVTGELAASSEAPVIVIAPHSSFLDVFVLCVIHSTPSGISKMENLRTPVLGSKWHKLPLNSFLSTVGLFHVEKSCKNTNLN